MTGYLMRMRKYSRQLPLCFSIVSLFHLISAHVCMVVGWNGVEYHKWASLVAQAVKKPLAMLETWVWSLGREDPLEKKMATHSSILAWKISWTEEPGRLQSMGLQRVGRDWATSFSAFLWGRGWRGWWEWLLRGVNFLYGVMKMFKNKTMVIIVQLCKQLCKLKYIKLYT